jgi:hypothetical protein
MGNAYLKWAFSEAAMLFLRANPAGQKYLAHLEKKHGKGKALTVLAHTLKLIGRCEVVNGEGIELLARSNEGIEDCLPEAIAASVVINRPGVTRVTHKPLHMASEAQQDM